MNEALITFLVTFGGGVLAGVVAHWLESRYEPVRHDSSKEAESRYSRSKLALVCTSAIFAAWVAILWLLGGILLVIGFGLTDIPNIEKIVYSVPLGLFLGVAAIGIGTAWMLKCDVCSRAILEGEMGQRFRPSRRMLQGWAYVVLDILFRKRFQCMSCGKRYFVGLQHSS